MQKNESMMIILSGGIIGIIASCLVYFGNPMNMGFCIACFLRDTAGGLGLHSTATVQYIRPEIIGLILGSFIIAVAKNEFNAKGGSSPLTRFILAFFVMIGCLMFLGCPFRMILRLAGGDLNAIFGLVGFIAGIMAGVFFLNKGYSLKRTYKFLKILKKKKEQDNILLVAHSCTSYAINNCFFNSNRNNMLTWTRMGNASIICFNINQLK